MPNGQEGTYNVIERSPSVFIVALNEDEEIYLVKISRYTTGITSWEIPAGGVNKGERLLDAVKRALEEETGLICKDIIQIGEFQSANGTSDQIAYTFLATDLVESKTNKQEEEGIDKLLKVPFKKALEMIKTSEINDGQSIVAITQVGLYKGLISL